MFWFKFYKLKSLIDFLILKILLKNPYSDNLYPSFFYIKQGKKSLKAVNEWLSVIAFWFPLLVVFI